MNLRFGTFHLELVSSVNHPSPPLRHVYMLIFSQSRTFSCHEPSAGEFSGPSYPSAPTCVYVDILTVMNLRFGTFRLQLVSSVNHPSPPLRHVYMLIFSQSRTLSCHEPEVWNLSPSAGEFSGPSYLSAPTCVYVDILTVMNLRFGTFHLQLVSSVDHPTSELRHVYMLIFSQSRTLSCHEPSAGEFSGPSFLSAPTCVYVDILTVMNLRLGTFHLQLEQSLRSRITARRSETSTEPSVTGDVTGDGRACVALIAQRLCLVLLREHQHDESRQKLPKVATVNLQSRSRLLAFRRNVVFSKAEADISCSDHMMCETVETSVGIVRGGAVEYSDQLLDW
ncbi:hypothetical protein RRG08_013951 [Elysia crispata]|uniref:Uncharacterized protein n=1 Tax=Elysia crispata TaxID=231223 RepID=A0AAE1AEB6_9GAST|nr:hypothetical protein RRG08_013951 [Elysia crispata]